MYKTENVIDIFSSQMIVLFRGYQFVFCVCVDSNRISRIYECNQAMRGSSRGGTSLVY